MFTGSDSICSREVLPSLVKICTQHVVNLILEVDGSEEMAEAFNVSKNDRNKYVAKKYAWPHCRRQLVPVQEFPVRIIQFPGNRYRTPYTRSSLYFCLLVGKTGDLSVSTECLQRRSRK